MKITISRHLKQYIILYLALLLALYLVIIMVPKVTDVFETRQILEPGELVLTDEATGYVIKTETINTSPVTGSIKYLVKVNTAVRKNQRVVEIRDEGGGEASARLYEDLMQKLEGYDGVAEGERTPISGLFSLTMDGAEKVLNPENMDKLTYKQVKDLSLHGKDLEQNSVRIGDPIYKITDDNKWYVVCWLNKKTAANYEEGQDVQLEMPAGTVKATVRSIAREKKRYKVIFRSDMFYAELPEVREMKMVIQSSDRTGLLVDNDCIISKDGYDGVYVRDKNGEYNFTRINILETDGKDSVISETSFIDLESGKEIFTVRVYDEVLKNPKKELKRDLKEEEKAAKKKAKEAEKKKEKEAETQAETQAETE